MNKSKKYHCGLLVVAVIAFFSLTSVNASDNFVKISLPKGVSIELPKNWIVLSNNQRIDIDTFAESALDLAGIEYENTDLPFAANYFKNGETVGIINIRYYSNLDFTQNDSRQATLQDINALNTTLKESIVKSMTAAGMSVLSWTGTKKSTINGITVFVTEYRRQSIKGIEAFRVRLIRVFAGDRSFTLTVSYVEEESFFLKPITDRIISSLKLSGINETSVDEKQDGVFDINTARPVNDRVPSVDNSQVYTKPTSSNTDSVASQFWVVFCAWLALSAVYTWGIGLVPPLIIRFLLVRRPIGKWWAIGTAAMFFFINLILFTILDKVLSDTFEDLYIYRSKSHGALILVAVVSYFILRKKLKHKSQSGKKHTKEKAVKTKLEKENYVVSSKSPVISKSKKGSMEAGASPCPKCSQLNTSRRTTCKNCGILLRGYCPKCKNPIKHGESYCSECYPNKKTDTVKCESTDGDQKIDTSNNAEIGFINQKIVRYVAIGVGILITLALLYINEGPLFPPQRQLPLPTLLQFPGDPPSRTRTPTTLDYGPYGLFASDIEDTMAFKLLRSIINVSTLQNEYKRRYDKEIAYFLWFVCFGGGVFLSWKSRFKTVGVLIKVIKTIQTIHEKA